MNKIELDELIVKEVIKDLRKEITYNSSEIKREEIKLCRKQLEKSKLSNYFNFTGARDLKSWIKWKKKELEKKKALYKKLSGKDFVKEKSSWDFMSRESSSYRWDSPIASSPPPKAPAPTMPPGKMFGGPIKRGGMFGGKKEYVCPSCLWKHDESVKICENCGVEMLWAKAPKMTYYTPEEICTECRNREYPNQETPCDTCNNKPEE